jgi:biopolymer transport protein ExbD
MSENKPVINITPLIDILLVLLIIFMVASPLRPHKFNVSLPSEQKNDAEKPNPLTLVVTVGPDQTLKINTEPGGTIDDPAPLTARLSEVFRGRLEHRVYVDELEGRTDIAESDKVERTVFVKAHRSLKYGEIAKVVDVLKGAGATPISFQLDDLER